MIKIERIMNDIETVAKIENPKNSRGCTRHSYSEQDKQTRRYLEGEIEKLGLTVMVDGMGNMRARLKGDDPELAPVLIGSHIDTVTSGGKYDGLTGVVSALECLRSIREDGVAHRRAVELIVFAEEEGSNFGITMLGSKALVGKLGIDGLKKITNDDGVSAYDLIAGVGYDVDAIEKDVIQKGDVHAMVELHIEQGGRLDSINKPIGIVQKIAGMETYKIAFKGVSNHAGSTLMKDRKDPMLGAAELILAMNERANGEETGVATVGKIINKPNSSNAIAGAVDVFVDLRDVSDAGIGDLNQTLYTTSYAAAKKYGLNVDVELLAKSEIVDLSDKIKAIIEEASKDLEIDYHRMNSGAVHDSVMLADISDVGMIFVPSVDGMSHCPEEFTQKDDILLGCNLLLETAVRLANDL